MKNVIKIFYIVISIIMLSGIKILAVPAYPDLVTITQSDSSKIKIYLKGDENINWFESLEQFTLLKDKDDFIVYATKNVNGDLIPSKHRYWNKDAKIEVTKERMDFIDNLGKKLFFSEKQVADFINSKKPNINTKNKDDLQQYNPQQIEGTRKYLVILMSYIDLPFTKTQEEFDNLFNANNYGNYGSVRDYYIQNSYGKFTPEFVVVGPYSTTYGIDYYRNNSKELVQEAVTWAFDELQNIAQFDNNNNGVVDAVHIIFSGWGQETGFQQGIWSHASALVDDYGSPNFFIGGKYVIRYCCSPELRGNGGNEITTIGVSVHEFCHTLGAPDYYDTDYGENGQYQGAGNWCLMSNGSWNGGGQCPAGINIFQKWLYSWVDPINLTTEDVNVYNMPNSFNNSVAYRIDTDTEDEFYIMENRQRVGFDRFVPGHGLLIWHIHSFLPTILYYGYNAVNNTHPQLMYPVCAGATSQQPTNNSDSYGYINSNRTPFPGETNNTEFTDNSTPSACSWNKKPINRPITNITEVDSFINFNYKGRPSYVFNIPYSYNINIDKGKQFIDFYSIYNTENNNLNWRLLQENNGNYTLELRSFPGTTPSENYLYLPAFQLHKNYIYTFSIDYKVYSSTYPGNLKLYLCNSKNINDKILIQDFGDELNKISYTSLTVNFNVFNDMIYYFALVSNTKSDGMQLFIDNIEIKGTVGIAEYSENTIRIFPNPAKNNLYVVNLSNQNIENIDIFNIEGKNVLSTKKLEIDISNLNAGTYIVKITTKDTTHFEVIIKN